MSREPFFERKTSIAFKTEEKTVLRGYNLSDLAEEGYSFCDAIFVLFQGRIPTEAEEQMLKYEMGSFLEHSMSPSAGSAIAVTAGRPNLPTAVSRFPVKAHFAAANPLSAPSPRPVLPAA